MEYEEQILGRIPLAGPGRKVQESAKKLEEVLKITEEHASEPNPQGQYFSIY